MLLAFFFEASLVSVDFLVLRLTSSFGDLLTLFLLLEAGEGLHVLLLELEELLLVVLLDLPVSPDRSILLGGGCFERESTDESASPVAVRPGRSFADPRLLGAGFFPLGVSYSVPLPGLPSEVLSFLPGPFGEMLEVLEAAAAAGVHGGIGDVVLGIALDLGDADAGEDDREEAEERLEDEESVEDEPLELDELEELLRSLLRRHADCDPLSRKGQSVSPFLPDSSLLIKSFFTPLTFPFDSSPVRLYIIISQIKSNYLIR